jgi:hypothetical protein
VVLVVVVVAAAHGVVAGDGVVGVLVTGVVAVGEKECVADADADADTDAT